MHRRTFLKLLAGTGAMFSFGFTPALNGKSHHTNIRYGFINRTGKIVIAPRFELALGFSDSRAAVQIDGKWGYIDAKGNIIIPPIFAHASEFSEGIADAQNTENGRDGYINKKGEYVIKPQFYEACSFSEGFAAIGAEI